MLWSPSAAPLPPHGLRKEYKVFHHMVCAASFSRL